MSNYSQLYWLTRLDAIYVTLFIGLLLSGLALIILHVVIAVESQWEDEKIVAKWRKKLNKLLYIFIPCLLLSLFMPSKQEVIFIYAGGKTMDFIQSDTSINKIPAQTTKLITDYLDKQIKDAKETK